MKTQPEENTMEMNPSRLGVVSVIMPVYNTGKIVSETIDSVLSQTWHDFEFIIIDDGSRPETSNIIKRYSDSRIRYYYQENRGMAAARNRGIELAQGEYLAFLDHDDIWLPEKLERQIEIMQADPSVGLVYSPVVLFNSEGERWEHPFPLISGFGFYDLLAGDKIQSASCVLIRRETLREIKEPFCDECKPCDDWYLWLSIAFHWKIQHTTEKLVLYRIHANNVSNHTIEMYEGGITVLRKLRSSIADLISKKKINRLKFLILYHYSLSRHFRGIAYLAIYDHNIGRFFKYNALALLHNVGEYRNWLLWMRLLEELFPFFRRKH